MDYTVLFVDDEPNVLAGFQRGLRKEPYELLYAGSVREAISILRDKEVDVIVSDQNMPGITGMEFLAKLGQTFPEITRFILTGKATREMILQATHECVVSQFLTKPISNEKLALVIRQALAQKDLLAEARNLLHLVPSQSETLENWIRQYPGILALRQVTDGAKGSTQARGSSEDMLSELHKIAADQVLLVGAHSKKLAPGILQTIEYTHMTVRAEGAEHLCRQGERLLVLLHVLPQRRYIVPTIVDSRYTGRVELACQVFTQGK